MTAAAGRTGGLANYVSSRLGRRLLVVLFAILALLSLLLLVLVLGFYRNQLVDQHARASLEVNHLLQASLENAMLKRDIPGLRDIVTRLGSQDGIAGVMIVNPLREVRFASDSNRIATIADDTGIEAALATLQPQTAFVSASGGGEWLRSVIPVANKPQCMECHGAASEHPVNGLLVVDYDAAGIRQGAARTAALLGASGFLVILVSAAVIWLALDRLVLRRVARLRQVSALLGDGALEARAMVDAHDELGGFAESFNRMADGMQQMIADVAAAEQALQSVIDAIPDGVRVIDSDYRIRMVNDAYCRQLGQPRGAASGQFCYRSSHGRSEPCPETITTCPVAALREGHRAPVKLTDAHVRPDGDRVFVEVSAAPVELRTANGTRSCVVEAVRDLSQDVEISQKHRLSEIGLLATGVAHEIHNPLSSIELALTAIRDSLAESGRADAEQHYIDIAKAEIGKCLEVTEGLMRLSEPPREPVLVAIDRAIADVVSLLSFQIEGSGIRPVLDFTGPLRVLASDSDIRMIAINLAQNAIHAMPSGGELRIAGRIEGGDVILHFADTGIGIAHEYLDKIFLPFWTRRADGSTGRGLGLSICKAIVERYGGTISVSSTLGQGTRFTVVLPSADAAEAGAAAA